MAIWKMIIMVLIGILKMNDLRLILCLCPPLQSQVSLPIYMI